MAFGTLSMYTLRESFDIERFFKLSVVFLRVLLAEFALLLALRCREACKYTRNILGDEVFNKKDGRTFGLFPKPQRNLSRRLARGCFPADGIPHSRIL